MSIVTEVVDTSYNLWYSYELDNYTSTSSVNHTHTYINSSTCHHIMFTDFYFDYTKWATSLILQKYPTLSIYLAHNRVISLIYLTEILQYM